MTRHAIASLPEGSEKLFSIQMKNDRKTMLLVNGISILLCALMLVPYFLFGGLEVLRYAVVEASGLGILSVVILLLGMVVYIVLHELTHGLFFRLYSGTRPKYGFNVIYAYAYHDALFRKGCYLWITLSPVVILGGVLALLSLFLPAPFCGVAYIIEMLNVSGAAGDFYVTVRLLKTKGNVWIKDDGHGMTVYRLPDENE